MSVTEIKYLSNKQLLGKRVELILVPSSKSQPLTVGKSQRQATLAVKMRSDASIPLLAY